MEITREKHMNYLTRLMPVLLLAYIVQSYLYMQWAPKDLAIDVSIFVGVGICLIALCFALYDHFHKVELHRHHLVIGINLLKYREEILYRNIQEVEVEVSKHAFYNVTLTLRDGTIHKIYYLDDVQDLKKMIRTA